MIRPSFIVFALSFVVGCATIPPEQARMLVNGVATNPPPRDPVPFNSNDATLKDKDFVISDIRVAPQPLPAGNFIVIIHTKEEEIPRIILQMSDGASKGDLYMCNFVRGRELAVECSGKDRPTDASCIDRRICFPEPRGCH